MCYGSILQESIGRARKRHLCATCHRPIEVGQRRLKQVVKDGGEIMQSMFCIRCSAKFAIAMEGVAHDECVLEGYADEHFNISVRQDGWKSTLARLRAARDRLLRTLTKRGRSAPEVKP